MRKFYIAAFATLACSYASAADWMPDRPLRLVVPFSAGGPTDALARHLAEALRPALNQTVIVDNRPGAGGNLGAGEVARAKADGLTLLLATSGQLVINKHLYKHLNYDSLTSFDPIVSIGDLPNILTVNPQVPARSVSELVSYAHSRPEGLTYASSGSGATSHLAGVLFARSTGLDLRHVPYRGTGPAVNDLVAGHVDMTFTDVMTAKPLVEVGKLTPVGVTTLERSTALPAVQTLSEQGLTAFDISVFFGILVPKGTPAPITRALNAAFCEALAKPGLRALLQQQGIRPDPDQTAEHLRTLILNETPKWQEIIKASGAQLD